MHRNLNPKHWDAPKGYSNGVLAKGTYLVLGGQIGWNEHQKFESDDFLKQVEQSLLNIKTLLECANAKPEHMVRMTWYVINQEDYCKNLKQIGQIYRSILGNNYPAMTCIFVSGLVEKQAKLEIEVTVVIPSIFQKIFSFLFGT